MSFFLPRNTIGRCPVHFPGSKQLHGDRSGRPGHREGRRVVRPDPDHRRRQRHRGRGSRRRRLDRARAKVRTRAPGVDRRPGRQRRSVRRDDARHLFVAGQHNGAKNKRFLATSRKSSSGSSSLMAKTHSMLGFSIGPGPISSLDVSVEARQATESS